MTTLMRRNGTTNFDTMFDELMDSIFTPVTYTTRNIYIEREDDCINLHISAVGLSKSDLTIKFKNDTLTVTSNVDKDKLSPIASNINHSFRVPKEFDGTTATAKFDNGILTISLERLANSKDETVIDIQ